MLGSILSIATGGLKTSQDLIGTVSRNISNSSTPGYSKKTQASEANVWTGGVLSGTVQRAVNESLTRKVNLAQSGLSQLNAELGPLEELDAEIGDPQSATSLASRITSLANAYQQFATDPAHSVTADKVVSAAQDIADTFKSLDQRLQTMADDATEMLRVQVAKVNEITARIADLNREISSGLGTGRDVTDLQDTQDSLIAELSIYMNVKTFRNEDGITSVYTSDNRMLAEVEARELHVVVDTDSLTDPANPKNVTLLQLGTSVPLGQNADGSFSASITRLSGSLGGYQNIINEIVPNKLSQLDALADLMTTQFQTVYDAAVMSTAADPTLLGLFTRAGVTYDPIVDPTSKNGLAAKLTINQNILDDPLWLRGDPATTAAGDTTLLIAAQDLLQDTELTLTPPVPLGLPVKGSLEMLTGAFHGGIADDVSLRRDQSDAQQTTFDQMSKKLSDETGVNMDDEMSRLIMLQNMYSANARIITAVDEMYDALFAAVR